MEKKAMRQTGNSTTAKLIDIGDEFLWVKWPNQQCQSTVVRLVLRIRLQSYRVHPTMLAQRW